MTSPTRASDSPTAHSPPLDESPTLVGSLSYARRRAARQEAALARSNSPLIGEGDSTAHPEQGRVKLTNRTQSALMDILDPDADGSTVVAPNNVIAQAPLACQTHVHLPLAQQSHHTAPHGKLQPLIATELTVNSHHPTAPQEDSQRHPQQSHHHHHHHHHHDDRNGNGGGALGGS